MGTSRRLLGLVLLLVVVGGGGYLLYGEHQRQTAEREAAATAPPAEPPAANTAADGETASTSPPATSPAASSSAPVSSAPASTASESAAAAANGAPAAAPTAGAASSATTGAAADGAAPAGTAASSETAAASSVAAASNTAPAAGETISQPEPVVPPVAGEVAAPGVPTFDVVRVEPGGDAVMAGRSEPGMVIALFANGREIGRTRANDSGEWVIALEEPLGPGEYVVTIVGATADGTRQVESVDRIAVSIPEGKSEAPMVALVSPDAPTKVLQQPDAAVAAASGAPGAAPAAQSSTGGAVPAGGEATAVVAGAPGGAVPPPTWAQPFATGDAAGASQTAVTASPSATQPAAGTTQTPAAAALAVGVVEKDGDTVTVSGASLPGATVRVYLNDAPIGETVADAAGRWTFTGPHAVEAGDHTVRADQLDPATGAVVARSAVPFEVLSAAEIAAAPATSETPDVALPPQTPAETATVAGAAPAGNPAADAASAAVPVSGTRKIRIRRGDDLWTLAERYYGKRGGLRYTAIYRANRQQIRDPDLIYPGQVFIVPR